MNSGRDTNFYKFNSDESTIIKQQTSWPEGYDSVDNDIIYTTEPLPFIQSLANGKLVINPRARDMLSRIKKPLVVISIAGLYRTGNDLLTSGDILR